MTIADLIAHLRRVRRRLRTPLVVVLDNLRQHTSAELMAWREPISDVFLEFLPPYATELNAIEPVWSHPIQVEVSQSPLSGDAGLLIFRQMDERLRYTEQFAHALRGDSRVGPTHSWLDMVRQRVYGMLADYEDQNDHDVLRSDPVFKVIAGRDPSDPKQDLASQPTLSRFENAISIADLNRLRELFVTLFIQSFDESLGGTPPTRITLDLDAWDDATRGPLRVARS